MPLVGLAEGGTADASAGYVAAFRSGLGETGYVEGQNVTIEYHRPESQYDRLPAPTSSAAVWPCSRRPAARPGLIAILDQRCEPDREALVIPAAGGEAMVQEYVCSRVLVSAAPAGHLLGSASASQNRDDGTIIDDRPCTMLPLTYSDAMERAEKIHQAESEFARKLGLAPLSFEQTEQPSEAEWNDMRAHEGFECRFIRYKSRGLVINGFLYKPATTGDKLLPVVILNRGGNRNFGAWVTWTFVQAAYAFGKAGFVVLASQYRGGGGSQGQDEFGGADVDDVLSLVFAAKALGYADPDNIFMFGTSRGGMMTYLSIRRSAPIRAAAVLSGAADLEQNVKERPEMRELFSQLIPGFAEHEAQSYRDRSAVMWAEELNVPVLLMHGTADCRVSAIEVLRLAQELQRHNKTYQLMMFANDAHGLPAQRSVVEQASIAWFKKFMR
jgi:dienelactone hydrolase